MPSSAPLLAGHATATARPHPHACGASRQCKMEGLSAAGFDISGALLADGDFTKVNFKESQLSKVLPHSHTDPQPHRPTDPQTHAAARA